MLTQLIHQHADLGEIHMLAAMSGEILNFRPGARVKTPRTLFVSPYLSGVFGLDLGEDGPCLGVPGDLFDAFMEVRWMTAHIIAGKPGLYLLFQFNRPPQAGPVTLRLDLRRERVRLLEGHNALWVVRMDEAGNPSTDPACRFKLPLKPADGLYWEQW